MSIPSAQTHSPVIAISFAELIDQHFNHELPVEQRKLVPAAALPQVITQLERALVPMSADRAPQLLRRLLSSYATRDLYSEEGYTVLMLERISRYPLDIARAAIDELIDTLRWLPKPADFVVTAERLLERPRVRLEIARYMLQQHLRNEVVGRSP